MKKRNLYFSGIIGIMYLVISGSGYDKSYEEKQVDPSASVNSQIIGESKLYVLFPYADSIILSTDDTSEVTWSISKQGRYGSAEIHSQGSTAWLKYVPGIEGQIEDTLIATLTNGLNETIQKVIYAEIFDNKYQCYGEKILDKLRKDFYHPVSGLFVEYIDAQGKQSGIPCYLWPASHMLRALKNGYRVNPGKYRNALRNYAFALDKYKTTTNGIVGYSAYPGDPVRFYDDNGLLVIQFSEISQLLVNNEIFNRALLTYDFNNSDRDENMGLPQLETELGQGMFYSMSVNQTALGAAMIGDILNDTAYLNTAKDYYKQLNNPDVLLKDPAQALFHGYTFYQNGTWSYSGTINGITRNGSGYRAYQTTHVIQLAIILFRSTLDVQYLDEAKIMMEKCIGYWYRPSKGLSEISFWGGDDMIDALIDIYNVTGDNYYLNVAKDIIDYLIGFGRDYYGYYPSDYNDKYGRWNLDRRNLKPTSFLFMGQAAAASGILRVARADQFGPENPILTDISSIDEDQVIVYPTVLNKTGSVNIKLPQAENQTVTITLTDVSGQKVKEVRMQNIPGDEIINFSIDDQKPGLYFITINRQSMIVTKKIIINRS